MIDLRLGRWQSVLADVERCDAVICDPPYTSRVVFGYRSGSAVARGNPTTERRFTIPYDAICRQGAAYLMRWACARAGSFVVVFNDHVGWQWLDAAARRHGWYSFAPVAWVRTGSTPRFQGDGPADVLEYISVSRPRHRNHVGSLPGCYRGPIVHNSKGISGDGESVGLVGQKPLWLMRAIIRDYTKPGDLIVDPFAGSGTTLIAARAEGRDCIGAEMDVETHAKAMKRIAKPYTVSMGHRQRGPKPKTEEMW